MNAPAKPPGPSQLAALEQAYSSSPAEGWQALAEAYVARNRAMEAMVIARRGARLRPGDPAPRVMLARLHAAQRRPEKAREEIAQALALAPADPEVLALAKELGVEPPPPAEASPPPTATPERTGHAAADAAPAQEASPARRGAGGAGLAAEARWAEDLARRWAGDEHERDPETRRRRARRGALRTAALAVAAAAVLGAVGASVTADRRRADERGRLLGEAARLLDQDRWPAYREAQERCERAAGLGGDARPAHACAAWAAAVRWAEHGEGEALRARAAEHLAKAGAGEERPARAVLAEAWLRLHGGDARGAIALVAARAARDGSPAVQAALGEARLQAGELEAAREALAAAQQLAPGSPRIAALLAEAFRRGGEAGRAQAETLLTIALEKLAADHVPALLAQARLQLDRGDAAAALATSERTLAAGEAASPRQRAGALALKARALAVLGRAQEASAAEREARALDGAAPDLRPPLAAATTG